MNDDNSKRVKGGIFAQADIDLLKKALDFYVKNNKTLVQMSSLRLVFSQIR